MIFNKKAISIATCLAVSLSGIGCSKGNNSEMGRYLEELYTIPEGIYYVRNLEVLDDGNIAMVASGETNDLQMYLSKDKGQSWQLKDINLPKNEDENKELVINESAISKKGDILISYYYNDQSIYEEEVKEEAVDGDKETIDTDKEIEYIEPEYEYMVIDAEGNLNSINMDSIKESIDESAGEDDFYGGYYYFRYKFADNGDLLCSSDNGEIYQLDSSTGEVKEQYITDGYYIDNFVTVDDSLIVITDSSVKEYDLESGEELGNLKGLEKEVLYENNSNFYGISSIFAGKDKTIYFNNPKGLYKYVLGEDSVEQIIDGSLSSLGDTNMYIQCMIASDDDEFLAYGQDYSSKMEGDVNLIHFYYSADTPKVPENQITVYSLYDDYKMRQNITLYQKTHPDTYVKFEVGLSGEDAVTESDALRTLNTEIMAGNGPDIILLDGMSNSYIEEGLLEDISDIIEEYTKDDLLFTNIVDAYTEDGKIYAFPTKFKVPVIIGEKEYVDGISDLKTLTEAYKKASEGITNTNGDIYMLMPENLISSLYNGNGITWTNDDGTINEDNIKEFLENAKAIRDALKATYSEEEYNSYVEEMTQWKEEYADEYENAYNSMAYYYTDGYIDVYSILAGTTTKLSTGSIYDFDTLAQIYSINKKDDKLAYKPVVGQTSNVFTVSGLIGVNAKSKHKDAAKKFIKALLSEEMQGNDIYSDGFPVNKAAFEKLSKYRYADDFVGENGESWSEDQSIGTWSFGGADGSSYELEMYWPTEEYIKAFEEQIETLTTPITVDAMVLKEVINAFEAYDSGESSLDEAVKTISDNIDLKLAE